LREIIALESAPEKMNGRKEECDKMKTLMEALKKVTA
jgi:hypothetical protein